MNKEVVKKYKKEFDHWLNGGRILVRYIKDDFFKEVGWMELSQTANFWTDNCIYIINDKYVKFRKALAESKTVQYNRKNENKLQIDDWVDFEYTLFGDLGINLFRIKPEDFKVGDWVRLKIFDKSIYKIKRIEYCGAEAWCHIILENFRGNVGTTDNLELWKPQPGKLCVFWYENNSYYIGIYKETIVNDTHPYKDDIGFSKSGWDNVAPLEFIDTLRSK